jgi:DNA polymerase I
MEDQHQTSIPGKKLFLVDGMSHIFRAFFAVRNLTNSQGLPTNAVFGFANMLRKLLRLYHPDYIAVAFDSRKPTFRHEAFEAYKANRTEMPDDLALQIPWIRRFCGALRIPILELERFEADDIIGTLASRASRDNLDTVIVSNDKDMFQLVTSQVKVLHQAKEDIIFDPIKVKDFFGVPPEQIIDVLGLMGDSSDNIPGAPGIGEKGARDLITRFGSIDVLLERSQEVERKTYRESLQNNRDQILQSRQLATISLDVPLETTWEQLQSSSPNLEELRVLCQELGFHALFKEIEAEAGAVAPVEVVVKPDIRSVAEFEEFSRLHKERQAPVFCLFAWNTESEFEPVIKDAALTFKHSEEEWVVWKTAVGQAEHLFEDLRGFWEGSDSPKVFHDAKTAILAGRRHGVTLRGVADDTMLISYLLQPNRSNHSFEEIVFARSGEKADEELASRVVQLARLAAELKSEMAASHLDKVYQEVELPLAGVLAEMEYQGIRVDLEVLQKLSEEMNLQITSLTRQIHQLAGEEFNINSPRQLGEILFEKLNLPAPKKLKKSGQYSTSVEILEQLAAQYELPRLMLEYRQLTKLKSTYVDALPRLIHPRTQRLHTSFNQTVAATGRLSSSNPNLQNIPIRTELGSHIRAAVVPEAGWTLLAADYSQVELRVLAHFSQDPVLVDAFKTGEDIHTRTAWEVFGIMPGMQTPELRRRAKAINFGIVYGQTAFGLAKELGIPNRDAQTFIQRYFERYQGVKRWTDATIAETRQSQLTRTLTGRLRQIPDISSKNPALRQFAERTAVNSPIQGTAADLIKMAMLRIHQRLVDGKFQARMLLQVHDELVFEVPENEMGMVGDLVKSEMEQVLELTVPLVAELGSGKNWRDAK